MDASIFDATLPSIMVGERRYLDPKIDVVFKLLFTKGPDSQDALRSLLTAVLRPKSPLARVKVKNAEIPRSNLDDRGVLLDIHAELSNGTRFDVEMQSDRRPAFRERALYYWARMFSAELERGASYESLRPAISVLFLDYRELEGDRLHSVFHLLESHDGQRLTDAIALHIIELPKLDASSTPTRNERALRSWSRFLAATSDEEVEAAAMDDPAINKARKVLEQVSTDPEAIELARLREMARATRIIEEGALRKESALARRAARKEGRKEGREVGLKEGREVGLKEGLKEGREVGREEGREEGQRVGLQRAVEAYCAAANIEIDEARRRELARASAAELQTLFDALLREKAWPTRA